MRRFLTFAVVVRFFAAHCMSGSQEMSLISRWPAPENLPRRTLGVFTRRFAALAN
jgi:hypothetical protein